MENHQFNFPPRCGKALALLSLSGLLFASGHAGQAQTLSLSPAASTAAAGSVVTYTVSLAGGTNLGGFDFNILLDPNYLSTLSYVGSAPFTSANTNPFATQFNDSATGNDLRVTYTQPLTSPASPGVDNNGKMTTLGSFQVNVLKTLPTAGVMVSFGPVGSANNGGSEVLDATTGANVLIAATGARIAPPAAIPEASQGTVLGLCLLGLGGLAFTSRRRAAQR